MLRANRVAAWLIVVGILALFNISFAKTTLAPKFAPKEDEERFTLTTYYPTPRGVYNEMQFYPQADRDDSECGPNTYGVIYMNFDNEFFLCTDGGWDPLGGEGNWTLTDPNLYPNDLLEDSLDWYVGIGLTNPLVELDVNGLNNGQLAGRELCIGGKCKPSWGQASCSSGTCLQRIDLANPQTPVCVPCGTEATP